MNQITLEIGYGLIPLVDPDKGAKLLDKTDVPVIELNISCPNVAAGGAAFGMSCTAAHTATKAVREVTKKPLLVKLTPQSPELIDVALSCIKAGADGISLINTMLGMRIDLKTKKPVIYNKSGGFSGPAIKPVAVRMVYQVSQAVNIPVIGIGGVSSAEDVLEMMMAGATAVEVGAANLKDPFACKNIIEKLPAVCERLGVSSISERTGMAHR